MFLEREAESTWKQRDDMLETQSSQMELFPYVLITEGLVGTAPYCDVSGTVGGVDWCCVDLGRGSVGEREGESRDHRLVSSFSLVFHTRLGLSILLCVEAVPSSLLSPSPSPSSAVFHQSASLNTNTFVVSCQSKSSECEVKVNYRVAAGAHMEQCVGTVVLLLLIILIIN